VQTKFQIKEVNAKMVNKTLDQKSGLFWFAAGVVITYFSLGYGIGNLGSPGPGYVAFVMGLVIMVLSAIMVLRDVHKGKEPLSRLFRGTNWPRVALTVAALLLYTILLPYIGFIVDSMILIYFLIFLAGKRNHVVAGIMAIAVSCLSYYLFSRLLQVALPPGLLGEWLQGRFL
jgi:putative tricarboxylic transport membrane protein